MGEVVVCERHGRVGVVILNRPEVLNAADAAMQFRCDDLLTALDEDPDIWAIVVTGAGERAFCVGADLRAVAARAPGEGPPRTPHGFLGLTRHELAKPVIAAVEGHCLGGGLEAVLACDLVVASETATFGLSEVKRGFAAGGGGLLRLPRQIPVRRALEMALTGDPIDAAEAHRLGLVNRVVPAGTARAEATVLAGRICENAPLAVRAAKRIIHRSLDVPLEPRGEPGRTAWDVNDDERRAVSASEDAREGPRAFAEKRTPVWTGR